MEQEQHITDNVHGWLMNVPHYRQDHSQDYLKKQRHLSTASISSEDSANLDELINGNFTTSMEEETDLNDLSLLDLDDSKEDFWKVDNIYIPTPTTFNKQKLEPSYYHKDSSRSRELGILDDIFQKRNKQDFMSTIDITCPAIQQYDTPTHSPSSITLHVPSLPVSPKSPILFQNKRSGSFSSEASMNSQSTIMQYQHRSVRPTESTSTSSFGSQSTAASALSRSTIPIAESTLRRRQQQQQQQQNLSLSVSESTCKASDTPRTLSSRTGLARRATHIPAPSSTVRKTGTRQSIIPQRTKSTATSNTSLLPSQQQPRSLSRMSQASGRASHIPTAPRSTTSLGIASTSSLQKQSSTPQCNTRSKPSIGNSLLSQSKTKSSGLRTPASRSLYKS
ncbi:hypothetical protein RMATCC62417_04294 [Rhizopus microsporus]|nr:hypothetical protein RMATCC62417_04294 [Rhizopus microsporus]